MKTIITGLLALALLLPAVSVRAQPAAVDAEHAMLKTLAGHWMVKQSLWLGDATTPKIDSGTADFVMVLKGRHLRQTLHIADGTDFEGLGYIGYDSGDEQFFSTWMDVNFPGLVVAYGGFDEGAKAYIFKGGMAPSTPDGQGVPVRETMTITDHNHMRYDYYETHGDKEALTVRLEYSR
jgi:hypothetical protein